MKIVHLNTHDLRGGAARAANRLHQGLLRAGQSSSMVVKEKSSADDAVVQADADQTRNFSTADHSQALVQGQYINAHRTAISNTVFTFPYPGIDVAGVRAIREADIINLHWVAYYQSPVTLSRLFSSGQPAVWTLHDQWPFTGGCHYSAGCNKYCGDCSSCPQLADDPYNLPAAVLKDKAELFKGANLTIVTPSRWLASCTLESALFRHCRVEVIPNSLDTAVFYPLPKSGAKASLGIAPDSITLLFGAELGTEKRKGFDEMLAAMRHCLKRDDFRKLAAARKITLLCFGHHGREIETLGLPAVSLGYLEKDEEIRTAFSASDMYILPSLEDNLPNTMLEAMSCGTPVIGFDTGGISDMVGHGVSGMVVPRGSSDLLGDTIAALVKNPEKLAGMSGAAGRKAAAAFGLSVQAARYTELYIDLCRDKKNSFPYRAAADNTFSPARIDGTVGAHVAAIYDRVVSRAFRETFPSLQSKSPAPADRACKPGAVPNLEQDFQEIETGREQEIAALKMQIAGLNEQLDTVKTELRRIHTSNSWLLTKPFRFMRRVLRIGNYWQPVKNAVTGKIYTCLRNK